jgi:ABC-2 type transport system ATP-binding protein
MTKPTTSEHFGDPRRGGTVMAPDTEELSMITVTGLTKRYADHTVVDDVSFTLEPGTVTGFLGPNGAGKTTTMRMITGLVPPTAGEATVGGRRWVDLPNPAAVAGTLLDAGAVHPGRTGRTHLAILAATIGVPTRRVGELLDQVGLGDAGRRRIGGYSLGMRQRLGIAAALLADPPVLILDEPANGLDPEGIRWMRELLRERADRGGTVLLSSHLLGEVQHTVDRLLVIGSGRIVADGPIGTMLAGDGVRVRAVDPAALAKALRTAGLRVTADGPALTVPGATAEQVSRIAAAGGHVLTDLRPADRGIEDLFFQLTA